MSDEDGLCHGRTNEMGSSRTPGIVGVWFLALLADLAESKVEIKASWRECRCSL